jgi:hypothetical protein
LQQKQFQKKQLEKYNQQQEASGNSQKESEEKQKLKAIEQFEKAESSILPSCKLRFFFLALSRFVISSFSLSFQPEPLLHPLHLLHRHLRARTESLLLVTWQSKLLMAKLCSLYVCY